MNQGPAHGRYLNQKVRVLKAGAFGICMSRLAAACMVGACRGQAERAGEAIAHLRLGVNQARLRRALGRLNRVRSVAREVMLGEEERGS